MNSLVLSRGFLWEECIDLESLLDFLNGGVLWVGGNFINGEGNCGSGFSRLIYFLFWGVFEIYIIWM